MPTIGSVAGRIGGSGIHIKPSRRGLLHKKLGIPAKEKIPAATLAKAGARAKRTGDTALAKEVGFARATKKFKHGGQKRETYGQVKKKVASGKM